MAHIMLAPQRSRKSYLNALPRLQLLPRHPRRIPRSKKLGVRRKVNWQVPVSSHPHWRDQLLLRVVRLLRIWVLCDWSSKHRITEHRKKGPTVLNLVYLRMVRFGYIWNVPFGLQARTSLVMGRLAVWETPFNCHWIQWVPVYTDFFRQVHAVCSVHSVLHLF